MGRPRRANALAGQPSAAQPSVGVGCARGLAEVQMGGLALLLVCGNSLAKASQMWEMKSDPGNQRARACIRRCSSVRRGRRPVLSLRNRFWRYLCRKTPEKKVAKSVCAHRRPCALSPVVADGPISCLQPIKLRHRRKQTPVWFQVASVWGYTCRVLTCLQGPTSEPRQREASVGRQRCPPAAVAPLEAAACHT